MNENDPHDGLDGLERFERSLAAAERRDSAPWLRRHWRRVASLGAVLALGVAVSPVGPAFGLLEAEYDHGADLRLAAEWGCNTAWATDESEMTYLHRCGDVPAEVANEFAPPEKQRDGEPGSGVGIRGDVIVVDGGSPELWRPQPCMAQVEAGGQAANSFGCATFADLGEGKILYAEDGPFPGVLGPTGPEGVLSDDDSG